MTTFTVKGPDEKTHTVDAPEGATQEDAIRFVKSKFYSDQPKPEDPGGLKIFSEAAKAAGRGIKTGAEFLSDASSYASMLPAVALSGDLFGGPTMDAAKAIRGAQGQAFAAPERVLSQALKRDLPQQGPGVEALMTGAEFAGSALMPGGPLKTAAKEAALFGAGGAAGSYLTGDDPVGSLIGGLGASTRGFFVPQLLKNAYDTTRRSMGAKAATTKEAEQLLLTYADDGEKALANVQQALANQEKGTLAQLSKDKGLLALEKRAADDPLMQRRLSDIYDDISTGAITDLRSVPESGADIQAPLKLAKERIQRSTQQARTLEQAAQTRAAEQATAQAEQAVSGQARLLAESETALSQTLKNIGRRGTSETDNFNFQMLNEAAPPGYSVDDIGQAGFRQLDDAFNNAYGEAWQGVETIPVNSMLSFRKAADDGVQNLVDEGQVKAVNALVKRFEDVGNNPSPERIREFDARLRNSIRSSVKGDAVQAELYETLRNMRQALRSGFPDDVKTQLGAIDQQYGKHLAVEQATRAARKNGGIFTSEQLLEGSNKIGGDRIAAGGAPLQQSAAQRLGMDARQQQQITQATDAGKAQRKTIEDVTKQRVKGITTEQQEIARRLRQQAAGREKVIATSPAAKFSEYEDTVKAVDSALDSKRPTESITQLLKTVKANPEAREGLRAGVVDSLVKRISSDGTLKKTALSTFDDISPKLKQLFSADELQKMRKAASEANKIYQKAGIKAANLPEAKKGVGFYLASIFGLNAGSLMATNPLMGAAMGKKVATELTTTIPHKNVMKKLNEVLLNPAQYADEIAKLQKTPTKKAANNLLQKWFGPAVQSTEPQEE